MSEQNHSSFIMNLSFLVTEEKPKSTFQLHLILVDLKVTNFGGHTGVGDSRLVSH
jgi:hypothetical protein